MDDLIQIIVFANDKIKSANENMVTYEQDPTADHADGRYSGTIDAYSEVVRKCAELMLNRR